MFLFKLLFSPINADIVFSAWIFSVTRRTIDRLDNRQTI